MKKMQTLTVNGNTYQVSDPSAVSFAENQSLTDAQKQQVRNNLGMGEKQYELIEDVTLDADATSFVRAADPNGEAYNFSAVRVFVQTVDAANAPSNGQIIFNIDGNKGDFMIYHQASGAIATSGKRTCLVARNDCGMVDYSVTVATGASAGNMEVRQNYLSGAWKNITKISASTYPAGTLIPAGTRIRIYAVRG